MKIAIAIDQSIHGLGGVEVLTRELILLLKDHHDIYLISTDSQEEIERDLHISHVLKAHLTIDPNQDLGQRGNAMVEWLHAQDVELCHVHLGGTYAWGAAHHKDCPIVMIARSGIRCITTNHQAVSPFDRNLLGIPVWRRLLGFLRKWPSKAIQLSSVDYEVMVSRHDLCLASRCYPFHTRKLRHIYHSRIDPAPPVPLRKSKKIVSLATVTPRKGQIILVRAFCRIADRFPDWSLHLYGACVNPQYREEIVRVIADHHLTHRISIEGPINNPMDILAEAEIYVQPSLLEGLGLSLQEALHLGRPCIGSRVGGIPELIKHEVSGLLVKPGDVEELSTTLQELIKSRIKREKLSKTSHHYMEKINMNRENMLYFYNNIYTTSN